MKNKMFKIVGAFSFFISFIALLGSFGLAFLGGSTFLGEVDESINTPVLAIEDYVKSKSTSKPQVPTTNKTEGSNTKNDEENAIYQKALSKHFDSVVKSIDSFSTITNQGSANREGLEKYLIKATKETSREEYLIFLESLSKELVALESKAKTIVSLESDSPSPEYVEWDGFLEWYSTSYMENFNNEKEQIALEHLEAQANKAEGLTQLIAAGSMFTLFILFVLIMLLVQIESNTRKLD